MGPFVIWLVFPVCFGVVLLLFNCCIATILLEGLVDGVSRVFSGPFRCLVVFSYVDAFPPMGTVFSVLFVVGGTSAYLKFRSKNPKI